VIEKEKLNPKEREFLRTEIAIIKLLNHSNIVQLIDIYEDKLKMYIVLEFVEGGELFDYIKLKKQLSEQETALVVFQLLETLDYLHQAGIVHRDLKPENILVVKDQFSQGIKEVKITDFGLSKMIMPYDKCFDSCGTLAYVAPEVLLKSGSNREVDLWSVGIILYLLLFGGLPFDSKINREICEKTIEAKLDMTGEFWDKISEEAKLLIRGLIEKDVKKRLSVK
jgi:serine/threonine protein kinase